MKANNKIEAEDYVNDGLGATQCVISAEEQTNGYLVWINTYDEYSHTEKVTAELVMKA